MPEIIRRGNEADVTFLGQNFEEEDLLVVRFEGTEGISELYRFLVEVQCDDPDLDLEQLAGKSGALLIRGTGEVRRVQGQVSRAELAGIGVNQSRYLIEIVPAVWYLTLRQDCRIFQEKDAKAIITAVLEDAGIPSDRFRFSLSGQHPVFEYCVQYRESDWAFISRLCEEAGIFYFFEHAEEGEVLVMADSEVVPVAIADPAEVKFHDPFGHQQDEEVVSSFRYGRSVRPVSYALRDHNFKTPTQTMHGENSADGLVSNLALFDYPGEYAVASDGATFAEIRLQEQRAYAERGIGEGNVKRFTPGYRVTMENHAREGLNREYLITRVIHHGVSPQASMEEAGDTQADYMNSFELIPSDVAFRPPRITPRPVVHGVQPAVVTGPSGEEIYCDEYGRVKVQFFWDRRGEYNEKSSCWIQPSHAWMGGQYGSIFLPRIGQEVIVDFVEGNPNRPVIVGRVNNQDNMPPYALPDEKTKSTIKTNSSTGGGGFNEIRFEDKAGEEQIFIHAQKDVDMQVLNDRRELIGNDRALVVRNDRKASIENDDELTVANDRNQKFGRDLNTVVGNNENLEIGVDYGRKVKGKESIKVTGTRSVDVGNYMLKAGQKANTDAGMEVHIKGGMKVIIEAGMQISLTAGGSFVDVGPSGVSISGAMVMINSGGSAGSGSGVSVTGPTAPKEPGAVPEACDDAAGADASASGGEEIADPLELAALAAPWHQQDPEEEQDPEQDWIEIELKNRDEEESPASGEKYRVTLPDDSVTEGTLDTDGKAKIQNIDPGMCQISFPDLDGDAWEKV